MLSDDLKFVILMIVMFVGFLFFNGKDNRLSCPLAELSSVIPEEVLFVLGHPSFDQNIIWILLNVSVRQLLNRVILPYQECSQS